MRAGGRGGGCVVGPAGGETGCIRSGRTGRSFEARLRLETVGFEAAAGSCAGESGWVGGDAGLKSICSVFKSFARTLRDALRGFGVLEVVLDRSLGATILVPSSSILDLLVRLAGLDFLGSILVDRAKLA